MSDKQMPGKGNKSLLVAAVILLGSGGVAFCEGWNDRAIRGLGALACVASAYLIRKFKSQVRSVPVATPGQLVNPDPPSRPGPVMWALGAASVLLIGVSYFFLRSDAAQGYQQVWPVYFFGVAIVIGGSALAALVARMM